MPNCSAAHERCFTSRGSVVVMACLPPRGWSDTSTGGRGPGRLSPGGPPLSGSDVDGASDLRDSLSGPSAPIHVRGADRCDSTQSWLLGPRAYPPTLRAAAV